MWWGQELDLHRHGEYRRALGLMAHRESLLGDGSGRLCGWKGGRFALPRWWS